MSNDRKIMKRILERANELRPQRIPKYFLFRDWEAFHFLKGEYYKFDGYHAPKREALWILTGDKKGVEIKSRLIEPAVSKRHDQVFNTIEEIILDMKEYWDLDLVCPRIMFGDREYEFHMNLSITCEEYDLCCQTYSPSKGID